MIRVLILISAFAGLALLVYFGWPSPSPTERSRFEPVNAIQTPGAPPATDAPRAPLGPFAISGTAVGHVVVEQDGRPLASALVVGGQFRVEGLPGALVRVRCVADPLAGETVEIDTRTRAAHGIVLRTWPGASLIIETDASAVRARTASWTGAGKKMTAPAGLVEVTLVAEDREVTYSVMAPGTHRLSLMPEHGATIVGNAGIADGQVKFRTQHSSVTAPVDSNGRFRVEGMQPGRILEAIVYSPDKTRALDRTFNQVLYPGSTLKYDFFVQWGRIQGRIENGPARVTVAGLSFDATDRFDLAAPVGDGRIRASGEGTRQSFAQGVPYNVAPGCTAKVLVRMVATNVIEGSVRHAGAPYAGAVVRAYSAGRGVFFAPGSPQSLVGVGVSAADGRFSIELGAVPGIVLVAHAPGLRSPRVEARAGCVVELSPACSIAGVVLDDEDRPVAGREVTLMSASLSVRSGPDGRYRFDGLAPGPHSVTILTRPFFKTVERSVLRRLAPGEVLEDVVLRWRSLEALEGVVVDADGRPVSGIDVRAECQNYVLFHSNRSGRPREFGDPGGAATTNTRGEFRIEGLWGGKEKYDLSVARREILADQTTADHPQIVLERKFFGAREVPADEPIERRKPNGVVVRGRVTDTSGAGVAGILVEIAYEVDPDPWWRGSRFKDGQFKGPGSADSGSRSRADGSFEIRHTFDQRFYIRTRAHPDYADSVPRPISSPTDDVQLSVERAGFVAGFVRDEEGRAIEGIEITTEAKTWVHGNATLSESDGRFRLGALPSVGEVKVYVRSQFTTLPFLARELVLKIGPDDHNIVLVRGGFVTGVVLGPNGEPVEDIYVVLRAHDGSKSHEVMPMQAVSAFSIGPVPLGLYELDIRPSFAHSLPLDLPAKLSVRVPSQPLTLVTVPTRTLRGTAPAGFSVLWVPAEPRWERYSEDGVQRYADKMTVPASGQFELGSIREEIGSVYVFKRGDSRYGLITGARPDHGPIEVTLKQGGTIRGNVGGRSQWAANWAQSGGLRRRVRAASSGAFEITGLPPGRWVVRYEGKEWTYQVD